MIQEEARRTLASVARWLIETREGAEFREKRSIEIKEGEYLKLGGTFIGLGRYSLVIIQKID
jgi:hypothetical protein